MFQRSHHASIEWGRVAAFWERNPLCDLLRMYMCHQQKAKWTPGVWGAPFIYKLYRVGARMEPCGTSACISLGVESSPYTETLNFLLVRNELMSFIKFTEKCNFNNLYSKPGCHAVSKAFSIFKNTAAVDILLLKLRVTWSVNFVHWSVVLWRARKPNWFVFSKLLTSRCLWTIFRITFLNGLPIVDKRLMGPYLASARLYFSFLPRRWKIRQPEAVIK